MLSLNLSKKKTKKNLRHALEAGFWMCRVIAASCEWPSKAQVVAVGRCISPPLAEPPSSFGPSGICLVLPAALQHAAVSVIIARVAHDQLVFQ